MLNLVVEPALRKAVVGVLALLGTCSSILADEIPRPEHPTPDAIRPLWSNLNGPWQFRFDPNNEGLKLGWHAPDTAGFDQTIVVPFPWESQLSKIHRPDYKGVAWYRREFTIPESFPSDQRIWLRFGAVDWEAQVWVNGQAVAKHEGGYTPFEVDISEAIKERPGKPSVVVVRAFDPTDPSLPTGKQVGWYTHTSGIWQTVWLESRPAARIDRWTVKTEIDPKRATFFVEFAGLKAGKYKLAAKPDDTRFPGVETTFEVADPAKGGPIELAVPMEKANLWTPESPHLYDLTLTLTPENGPADTVKTYIGLRTIARGKYGDAPYERILLNGKPLYLRAALDQSFNPEGIYTAPSDDYFKRDMSIALMNGLNALRIHIKPDEPRRLFWADRYGILILEDMPNTWQQNPKARSAWEATMREAVVRDRNHPAIFTWVAFNETWGLGSPPEYKKDVDTQNWVGEMVSEIRKLDPTRLVEDNSPCNFDHVENTDLNSWHFYIDDHDAASAHIADVVAQTKPGSGFNYTPGRTQATAPLINSEYGGIGAGNGDRDVSWAFRDLTTLLRRQPKIQGYVYTELTDIEWEHNGFVDYNRAPKFFGYEEFVPDMRPNELNGADFIGYEGPPVIVAKPGEEVTVPIFISHFSERKGPPKIRWWWSGFNDEADTMGQNPQNIKATWKPYDVATQEPVRIIAPNRPFVGAVALTLRDENNLRIAANFVNLVVKPDTPLPRIERVEDREARLRFAPGDFAKRSWSAGFGTPRGKVVGRGKGYFEYHLRIPATIVAAKPVSFFLRLEAASKGGRDQVDFSERVNREDYPQTDTRRAPSKLELVVNGETLREEELEDDPADARGVLSHLSKVDPGSHGDLIEFFHPFSEQTLKDLAAGKPLVIRLNVPVDGGLSLYGADSGQYPFDPTLTIVTQDNLAHDLGVKAGDQAAVDRASDRVRVLVATGEASEPAVWSYTTSDPGAEWPSPGYEAKGWDQGKSGFGTRETPAIRVGTIWKSERIWLRRAFPLPKLKETDQLTLRLFHDEDTEVFINGKPLLKRSGYQTSYEDILLTPEQKSLFQEGSNLLAVSCHQSSGGQGIDLGLILDEGE